MEVSTSCCKYTYVSRVYEMFVNVYTSVCLCLCMLEIGGSAECVRRHRNQQYPLAALH